MTSGVMVESDGSILRVTLCRPETRNSQTPATWAALADLPEQVRRTRVRLVVLSGDGESFSSGLDRALLTGEVAPGETSLPSLAKASDDMVEDFIARAQRGFTWPDDTDVPVVAYVHGHAVGAGFQLALACDMVVVDPSARFAMRETILGLVPDLAGTGPLMAAVGYSRALEICLSGRWIDAAEAHLLGIATAVVPTQQWQEHQLAMATSLESLLPGAVGGLKGLLRDPQARERQRARERAAQLLRLRDLADLAERAERARP